MSPAPKRRLLALVGILPAALVVLPLVMRGLPRRETGPEPEKTRRGVAPARPDAPRSAPAGSGTPAPVPRPRAPDGCAGEAPRPQDAAAEGRIVLLVNRERQRVGLPPLKQVEPLTESARWFAAHMASEDYFALDHDSYRRSGGRLVRACEWSARIGWFYPDWTGLAENIAAGYATAEETVAGWMGSPTHRAKILGRGHWETGVGYARGGSERYYWVEDFGRRGGSFPVVIDGEAPSTGSARVSVYVYGTWSEMRVRNDSGGFSPWRAFANEFDWTLDGGSGTRRVTVEMRSGPREASASDTIVLGGAQPPT